MEFVCCQKYARRLGARQVATQVFARGPDPGFWGFIGPRPQNEPGWSILAVAQLHTRPKRFLLVESPTSLIAL